MHENCKILYLVKYFHRMVFYGCNTMTQTDSTAKTQLFGGSLEDLATMKLNITRKNAI